MCVHLETWNCHTSIYPAIEFNYRPCISFRKDICFAGRSTRIAFSRFSGYCFKSVPIYQRWYLGLNSLFFIAPDLFALVLGDKWLESGLYARYFALPLFLQFVAYPLSSTFYLLSKNKWLSYLEFLQLGLILAAFGTSLVLKSDSTFLILGLSIAYSIAYLCKIISLQIILKRVA